MEKLSNVVMQTLLLLDIRKPIFSEYYMNVIGIV